MSTYINNRELFLSIIIVTLNLYLEFGKKCFNVDTAINFVISVFVNILFIFFTWFIFLRNNKDKVRQNIVYLLALCFVTVLS